MLLQTVRPNIVQAIRAFRVEDLMQAAQDLDQHFLYANLAAAASKQAVLETLAAAFLFPAHFGKNLDALYDCMTDLVHKSGLQTGFVVVLDQLPDHARFDREAREQLLDVFREAADFWAERRVPFRCFYSYAVTRAQDAGADKPAAEPEPVAPAKPASKSSGPSFGTNMPMMSSAFDTGHWQVAA